MAGYVIVHADIRDEELFAEFRNRIPAVVEAHGGNYLVRGGASEVMDGDWVPDRVVVLEFGSVEQAKAYLISPEYAELKELSRRSAEASVIIAEGV